jgi:predicted glycosyltransferase
MTREAALMGIPTWTLFAGQTPAVDLWLEQRGMLRRLVRADQLARLEPRRAEPCTTETLRERGGGLEYILVRETVAAVRGMISPPAHRVAVPS